MSYMSARFDVASAYYTPGLCLAILFTVSVRGVHTQSQGNVREGCADFLFLFYQLTIFGALYDVVEKKFEAYMHIQE